MGGGSEGSGEHVAAFRFLPCGRRRGWFHLGGVLTAAKGISRKFERYLQLPGQKEIVTLICIYGLVARGVVFAMTGLLFAYAGFRVDPGQAGSMGDALEWLHQLPLGSFLYVAVAMGLAAFGIYNLVEERYRIVRSPSIADAKRAIPMTGS